LKNNTVNITDKLIDDLYIMARSDIPIDVLKEAKNCLLDYLGVTFAGAKMLRGKTAELLDAFDTSEGKAVVIGTGRKVSVSIASLVNGMHAHVAELDDGERFGMFHPGAPIISALLPIAQQKKISGTALLNGIVVGYEAAIRLGGALQPALKDRGYHATGVCGTIGAAVAIGVALDFSKQQLKDAFSAATTSASGILKVIKDVSELKPYNVGHAAQSGASAAMMAFAGLRGPLDVLGGNLGFLSIMSDNANLSSLAKREDGKFGIQRVYRKPYAACRHCHSPIEASLLLKERYRLAIQDIRSVQVNTHFWAVGGHEHTQIEGVNSAKMSIPYSVAVALAKGKAGLSEFTEAYIADETIRSLTKKVRVSVDDALTQLVPDKRAAIVEIETIDGERLMERVDLPKGEPETSLSDAELVDKFESLAQYAGKEQKDIDQIVDSIWNIETKSIELYALLME